jgi:hypothetical protein
MKNYTVITYIIGDYEVVHELGFNPATTPHVEYLLVTDNKNLKSDTWKIVYDEELDKPELLPFDRVFHVRYNLFKYTNNDIIIRIDGSIGVNKPLDPMIEEFINGEYDGCINIHPGRNNIIDECFTWTVMRGFPSLNSLFQIKYISEKFNYDFNKKGLIQLGISINKRGELTNQIDNLMQVLIIEGNIENHFADKKDKNYHVTRLDQTLFTVLINSMFSDKKWMFINDSIFKEGSLLSLHSHNSDKKLKIKPESFIEPYFNGKKVEITSF